MSAPPFNLRPKPRDVWTFKLPNKRRQTKTVGRISRRWSSRWNAEERRFIQRRHPVVSWLRNNKGRYSALRVRFLLLHGERLGRLREFCFYRHSGADAKRELAYQNARSEREGGVKKTAKNKRKEKHKWDKTYRRES